jgi:hypothetical protein
MLLLARPRNPFCGTCGYSIPAEAKRYLCRDTSYLHWIVAPRATTRTTNQITQMCPTHKQAVDEHTHPRTTAQCIGRLAVGTYGVTGQ